MVTYKHCADLFRSDSPVYSKDVHIPGKVFLKASLFEQVATGTEDVFTDRTIQWEQ